MIDNIILIEQLDPKNLRTKNDKSSYKTGKKIGSVLSPATGRKCQVAKKLLATFRLIHFNKAWRQFLKSWQPMTAEHDILVGVFPIHVHMARVY